MIDDLETAIQKVPGVSCLFFAEDIIIWATGSNILSLEYALNSSLLNLATLANINKMEVRVEKTVSQLFTLSTKHLFHLEYKGLPLKNVSFFFSSGPGLFSRTSPKHKWRFELGSKNTSDTLYSIPSNKCRLGDALLSIVSATLPHWLDVMGRLAPILVESAHPHQNTNDRKMAVAMLLADDRRKT
ncbi:hypothetical protein TNIN_307351 [Trichonephila inaurata madagascariensis]|uniref:Uncharacterized protein n=1 Tax=Trichonephila inaurata madagascariensis TaxID=2747483 RepID=A0A8X6JN16_9ARAC|nr:hypothetical protein TNIN_307351 [Trichonephila inaurata madagascariensis]